MYEIIKMAYSVYHNRMMNSNTNQEILNSQIIADHLRKRGHETITQLNLYVPDTGGNKIC